MWIYNRYLRFIDWYVSNLTSEELSSRIAKVLIASHTTSVRDQKLAFRIKASICLFISSWILKVRSAVLKGCLVVRFLYLAMTLFLIATTSMRFSTNKVLIELHRSERIDRSLRYTVVIELLFFP